MKQFNIYILLFFFLCLSCSHNEATHSFDKIIYSPSYSSGFSIDSSQDSSLIKISVYNPWQGANDVSSDLLIKRDSIIPVNFDGPILTNTAQRIVCMSSTHIALLDALDAVDKIVGVSGKQYISNEKILSSSRFIPDIGYEGNIDYESLVSLKPDLVLLFAVNGASSLQPKLNELGIPYLYVGDYLEESPLGKAEWLIPVAEVINQREKGIEKFNEIVGRYNSLKSQVEKADFEKPLIMLNAPFNGSWFMPSSQSYVARMVTDAGGEYIYKKNTGNASLPIDLEEALVLVSKADFWLNIGAFKSLEEVKNNFPKFNSANCVKENRLYNNNLKSTPGGGNDCYESGIVNPDLILRDLIKIFHPEFISEEFVYYRHLE